MVEGLLPESGGKKLLMRLEKSAGGHFLRAVESKGRDAGGARVTLLIGLLKAGQFDSALRASSELGVEEIRPILCERSVPRLKDDELVKKTARWQKILDESSKVSGFVFSTRISLPAPFDSLEWDSLPDARYAAMLTSQSRPLSGFPPSGRDAVFAVGPEGDWSETEAAALLAHDFLPVSLGPGTLRSSTAAILGCGWFRMPCQE
jgi:16S rRNA (uracil1498-N3)-methyltransferase